MQRHTLAPAGAALQFTFMAASVLTVFGFAYTFGTSLDEVKWRLTMQTECMVPAGDTVRVGVR